MGKLRFLSLLAMLGGALAIPAGLRAQAVSVSPATLSFGTLPLQQVSTPRTISLTNNGSTSLQINSIVASGGYAETNNCVSPLPSLANCTINVTFNASSTLGPVSGSIAVYDSDPSSPQIVNLFGTSVAHMEVGGYNPQLIPFGFYQSTVVINNLSTPITVAPSTSGQYTQSNNCPNPMPPSAMCSVQLAFAPGAAGALSGLLSVADVTEGMTFNWPLLGATLGQESPSLFFSPSGLYFWNQQVGTKSSTQFVTVTNQGSASIQISNIGIAGPYSILGDTCTGTTLQPYISWCGIAVSFTPTTPGYNFGVVNITSTDSASPQVVVLDGLALAQPALIPNSVTSTPQPIGTVGPARTITFTNYQSVPVHISSITASAGYQQTTTCGATVNAYSNCTITVSFAPQQVGPLNGSVTVVHDAANSPSIANLYGAGLASASMNITQQENAKPGDSSWKLTSTASKHEIEGFASATSVNRGSTISFYVNTAAPTFTMDIYRMGWYGGSGARRMLPTITLPGVQQPAAVTDPATFLVQCPWADSYDLAIPYTSDPTNWASGIYLVKLTESTQGKQSYMIFVVRDDQRASDLLFQSPTNTYNAYNDWGGYSLYSAPQQGYKVSFDRPYDFGSGSGQFMQWGWENSMLRFLEREGYDVTYATDTDTHENPGIFTGHKAVLDIGHDEYWSWEMRNNWEAARDSGINLAFLGSDVASWQVRYEPNTLTNVQDRTLVCYKLAALDPYSTDGNPAHQNLVTVRFNEYPVNRPEASLLGVMYIFQTFGEYDMIVANASHWAFANTGLQNGDHLAGLLGYEADQIAASSPSNVVDLVHSPFQVLGYNLTSDMTLYTANSGATVVSTGSMHWEWAMDDLNTAEKPEPQVVNPAVQQMLRNILSKFGAVAP